MNLLKNSKASFVWLTVFLCVLFVAIILAQTFFPVNAQNFNSPIVIIDPGHGGFDGGAVANDGTIEKDINLNIAITLERLLALNGFETIMTRTTDTGTEDSSDASIAVRKKSDLQNRLELMKKYPDAVFVSIHLNKFTTTSASGAQMFYSARHNDAKILAQNIQSNIVELLQPQNTRVIKQGTDSTYLLKYATVPAVIVECGFLSNTNELKRLKDTKYQQQLSFAIATGIIDYYGNISTK